MSDLFHECGIAAVYQLPNAPLSRFLPQDAANSASRLLPGMLLDLQNRGQLAAGITTFQEGRSQLIDTYKDVGSVTEVFRMNHKAKYDSVMSEYSGSAGIGHVRYATCGKDDRSYAQPFERHHIARNKWFSFAFNGQLANYPELKQEILNKRDFHLTRETDTEILMHLMCQELSRDAAITPGEMLRNLNKVLDGAWNLAYLNAKGDMFVSRDPTGLRPLCYAFEDNMFAAASESVALVHMGFQPDNIKTVEPGTAVIVSDGELEVFRFADSIRKSHCFFEWIYFANVGSRLDDRSVYVSRKRLGEELAAAEDITIDDDTIVVPVPDTAKAAADSMAYSLSVPSLEGLIRNRYIGRTFIEGKDRETKVRMKYTPLREVLEGKRVLLVEDSIVRSTTMRALISQLRDVGRAAEIHVRVACPPIIAPCFYGIDMSTIGELFAPKFMDTQVLTRADEERMATALSADSLRYLPVDAIARCVDLPRESLCQACVDGVYPTEAGRKMYQLALKTDGSSDRLFDKPTSSVPTEVPAG